MATELLWPRWWCSFFQLSLAAFWLPLCLATFRCARRASSLLWQLTLGALYSLLSDARFVRRSSTWRSY
jgi:hypothetical protein